MSQPTGEAPAIAGEAVRVETADGVVLVGSHHRLAACRARIVLVHGYGEHVQRYGHVVKALLAAGYECHLFDLRGHGASGGKRGHVPGFEAYRRDLAAFTGNSLGDRPGAPAVLVGHSLGGLIALSSLLHEALPFVALVLSSPFFAPAFDVSSLAEAAVRLGGRLLPEWSIPAGVDAEGLSRDQAVVDAYRSDPQVVRTVTLAWGAAVLAAQEEVLARAGEIRQPALFLAGGADPIADGERVQTVFERLGSPDKSLLRYDGYRHEVLNEVGWERVMADVVAWLDRRFPAPAPPPA